MDIGIFLKAAAGAVIHANHRLRHAALERIRHFFQVRDAAVLVPRTGRITLPGPQGMASSSAQAQAVDFPALNIQTPAQLGITAGQIDFDVALSGLLRFGAEVSLDGIAIAASPRCRPKRLTHMRVRIRMRSMQATPGENRLMAHLNQL